MPKFYILFFQYFNSNIVVNCSRIEDQFNDNELNLVSWLEPNSFLISLTIVFQRNISLANRLKLFLFYN